MCAANNVMTMPEDSDASRVWTLLISVRGPAAIHRQSDAGDRGSRLAAQKHDGASDFFDRDEALGGLLGKEDPADPSSRLMPCAFAWPSTWLSTRGVHT
jgi:hypothetical protein